jgi:mono/diheme cytochrome c family protein
MNTYFKTLLVLCGAALITSCGNNTGGEREISPKSDRSVQYFPNMYQDAGYSTYEEADVFPGGVEAQKPVDGTVSRGWMPYEYEDSNEGYASAKANLTNPVPLTEEHLTNGQVLYTIYCAICHGQKGDGKGHLVETEKILGVPSYDARPITEGSIYHVMYYGINTMGSYASQTDIEERWEITHYVEALRADLMGQPRAAVVDQDGNPVEPVETPAADADEEEEETMTMPAGDNDSEVEGSGQPQPDERGEQEETDQTTTEGNN